MLSETHTNDNTMITPNYTKFQGLNLYIETKKMVLMVESLCMYQIKFNLTAEKCARVYLI